jgi:molybdopterin synthase sulfur carrier subunit
MNYTINLFGITREIIGVSQYELAIDTPLDVATLLILMREAFPALKQIKSLLVAVNSEYAHPEQAILFSDEIALIPPVSGG